jgi:diguanylate cyclase (GGDEF)-like protein
MLWILIGSAMILTIAAGMAAGWLLHTRWMQPLEPSRTGQEGFHQQEEARLSGPGVRSTFCLALGHRLAESKRRDDPLCVILLRIDGYATLCDRHGLHTTRLVLEAAGRFLTASVRAMDWVARLDATTFALLLPNAPLVHARGVAERLRTTTAASTLTVADDRVPVTISAGIAGAMLADTASNILRRAEEAMEAAIEAGGNRSYAHTGRQLEPVPLASHVPCCATTST